MQVTYYEFHKEEVDAAMEGHKNRGSKRSLTHVPSRVENKEAFNILMVRGVLLSWKGHGGIWNCARLPTCLARLLSVLTITFPKSPPTSSVCLLCSRVEYSPSGADVMAQCHGCKMHARLRGFAEGCQELPLEQD